MELTTELLQELRACDTVEALIEAAAAHGVTLAPDVAKEHFATLHSHGEIPDDELENVAGGCGKTYFCSVCGGYKSSAKSPCPRCNADGHGGFGPGGQYGFY